MKHARFALPFILLSTACGGGDNESAAPNAEPSTGSQEPVAQESPAAPAEPVAHGDPPAGLFVDGDGVAAQGYDVVAYQEDHAATRGSREYTATHDGATYLFASAAHRDAFVANAARYLPAYGGYCAFAVAQHQALVPPNPETFKVQDGRTLLFFNGPYQGQTVNTLPMWDEHADDMLRTADEHWPTVRESDPPATN